MATIAGEGIQAEMAKDQDAREDLRRIEQEIVMEAERSVEVDDVFGDEQAAAEAAETAQQFEDAQL